MTESLQSRTRVAGKAHPVEVVEVTYAQIPVRATILQQMVDNFRIECATATQARLLPRLAAKRRKREAR